MRLSPHQQVRRIVKIKKMSIAGSEQSEGRKEKSFWLYHVRKEMQEGLEETNGNIFLNPGEERICIMQ